MIRHLSVRRHIEGTLPTAAEILRAKEENRALALLTAADIEFFQTGHDNWNGGTELWTVRLRVPVSEFVAAEEDSQKLCETITSAITSVLDDDVGFWISAELKPKRINDHSSAKLSGNIERRTRKALLDELQARDCPWHGNLNDIEFLERLYDLDALPSFDTRYENARQDIWQHCINNFDWSSNWVYADKRFDLYNCRQEDFLSFICEVLHPVVRQEAYAQKQLADAFNGHLSRDGWELVEDRVIDGRPVFVAEQRIHGLNAASQRSQAVAASIGADALYQ